MIALFFDYNGPAIKNQGVGNLWAIEQSPNKNQNRVEHLEVFLDELELLKLEIRLCVEMKLVSLKKQALLSELLDRIGKQVTGWRNASR